MVNLRELAESDLATTLEGDFALPVTLIPPDGEPFQAVGQILYDTVSVNPDTGQQVVENKPIITLRRSSLTRVPKAGETWHVRMPTAPSATAPLADFIFSGDAAPAGGASTGFIKIKPQKVEQSP